MKKAYYIGYVIISNLYTNVYQRTLSLCILKLIEGKRDLKVVFNKIDKKARSYFQQLKEINLIDFNHFILRHLIFRLLKTENILPIIISLCIVGFSVITQESRFVFIPQTSVAAFASFFIFTLIVSVITLVIYPIIIILSVNFINSYINNNSYTKLFFKLLTLLIFFIIGVILFTSSIITAFDKLQIVIIWIGLYFVLTGLYLTHIKHQTIRKISKGKIFFIVLIAMIMSRPLVMIFLHTSEALNITNINPQIYLTAPNCALLHNLDKVNSLSPDNDALLNSTYYQTLPNNEGCYLYGNTIRYSFAYDFVILFKKNIRPIKNNNGKLYNEYVRLSCYANNCYSENHIYLHDNGDIYNNLIKKGSRLDHPL